MAYLRFFLTHPRALSFGVLLTLFSSFGQTFLISIFVPRLLEEFALNTAQFGALYALATITSAASLMTALWAEIYGVESLGAIKGIVATFGIFATALGPISLGWLLKVGVSFTAVIPGCALLGVLALMFSFFARGFLRPQSREKRNPSPG